MAARAAIISSSEREFSMVSTSAAGQMGEDAISDEMLVHSLYVRLVGEFMDAVVEVVQSHARSTDLGCYPNRLRLNAQ